MILPGLPELSAGAAEEFGGLSFQHSERVAEWMELWLTDEEVNVLGHEDVAVEKKPVSSAESFEGVQEDGSGVVVVKVAFTPVTAPAMSALVT